MKNKFLLKWDIILWLAALTVMLITSCVFSDNSQKQTGTTAESVTTTLATQITLIPPKTIVTQTPAVITTTLPAQTFASTPTQIPTPIVEQTMLPKVSEQLVQELMRTNGNCQLPCWWGIELGENLQKTGKMFTTLGVGIWRTTISDFGDGGNRGYIKSGYFDPANLSYNVGISMDFYTVGGEIQFINVLAERPLRQYGEEEFVRDWEQYFLSSILQKYGQPQYVYLVPLNIADPSPPDHALTLYYPDLGINVSYAFYGDWTEDGLAEICFDITNVRNIELSLYNPKLADVWGTYLLPPELYTDPDLAELYSAWTWTTQTGMSIDSFYETYKNPENLDCIQVSQ